MARGFRVEVPEDDEGRAAALVPAAEMFARTAELPMRRLTGTAPELEPEWARVTGSNNTRVVVTPEEPVAFKDAFEALVAPCATRDPAEVPDGARGVRLLGYALPEASDGPPA
ncbi:hypothetical protein [Streptomyces cupreus]|uniref:Uncharacterized protein n=1 Tax=Streptomyces cupreus TaxID=2759956 RepID=A0A7X1J9D9_9ACTN|nr:hypothetical protein [Streptomyces cupreus]MBC2906641.1 hypothetical protein [Streptomyces cupreus]